ncbi:MAG: TetR/AcrR family transcriptional regulator [Candidatus Gracilibacteria bacterium]|nr:TetR/AcrR family transcriptional regulator [Candidatus Gracilibacteria bacterium]
MKTKLLEKIETLFWENSFADVTMDEIARELGMKKASVYYHFPSKEEMFIEVLEYSFNRYKLFIEALISGNNLDEILRGIIKYPLESKNLFAVVSQKGYCKIGIIRDLISIKNRELFNLFFDYLAGKYSFNQEKTILLQSILSDLSKKYCIFDCSENLDIEKLINEIKKIFF